MFSLYGENPATWGPSANNSLPIGASNTTWSPVSNLTFEIKPLAGEKIYKELADVEAAWNAWGELPEDKEMARTFEEELMNEEEVKKLIRMAEGAKKSELGKMTKRKIKNAVRKTKEAVEVNYDIPSVTISHENLTSLARPWNKVKNQLNVVK
jgi:hypothetical protein